VEAGTVDDFTGAASIQITQRDDPAVVDGDVGAMDAIVVGHGAVLEDRLILRHV
jgi:hypothetical protein